MPHHNYPCLGRSLHHITMSYRSLCWYLNSLPSQFPILGASVWHYTCHIQSFTIWHIMWWEYQRPWYSWIYCNAFCGISWATLWCLPGLVPRTSCCISARSTRPTRTRWTRLRSHLIHARTYPGAKVRYRVNSRRTQFFSFYLASTLSQLLELMNFNIVFCLTLSMYNKWSHQF